MSPASKRKLLNLLGLVILLAGLFDAIQVWRAQDRLDRHTAELRAANGGADDSSAPLAPEDSRKYQHDAEVDHGPIGPLPDQFTRWLAGFTQGKPLARLIAVGSIIASMACFGATRLFRLGNNHQIPNSKPAEIG